MRPLTARAPAPTPASRRASQRPYIQFSARLARTICARVAAGERLVDICADPDMPARGTVHRWARVLPRFKAIYDRAKAMGLRLGGGVGSSYCPVTAHEIVVRVSQGETLTAIADDPRMPPIWTIFYWKRNNAEFDEALTLAREALADRFADLGWKMAMEATPETAHLTRVRLGQLRWTAGIQSPRTHGRHRAVEAPEPPEVHTYLFRHFKIEAHPETGQHRVVTLEPDPETNLPVRVNEGPWTWPVDPVAKAAEVERLIAERKARERAPLPPPRPGEPDDDGSRWL